MKLAFLHRNFREMRLEKKTIFLAHAFTLIFCFFPWFSAEPIYGSDFYYNAFSGPGFLIGTTVFTISFLVFCVFVDKLLEKHRIKLPFSENYLYFGVGAEQILLLALMWSVLGYVGGEFQASSVRFGIFVVFVAQVSGLVATFLNFQIEQQKKVQKFFQNPKPPKNDIEK